MKSESEKIKVGSVGCWDSRIAVVLKSESEKKKVSFCGSRTMKKLKVTKILANQPKK